MKKLAILLCLGLGACQTIGMVLGTSVPPQTALIAANSYDVLETVMTGYLQLPPCGAGAPVTCRNPAAVANIVPAVRAGRTARNQIEALLTTNNGGSIPVASYNTLTAAITTLQAVQTQYNVH